MAPKIGPRGTTIQDVMNVATNGAQPVQSQYVYAPTPPTQPATTAFDYASLLAGQPAATYGQKYGGMPTAEYAKAMIIGGAQQARSVGELAALQASIANQKLIDQSYTDLTSGTNKLYPSFRARLEKPLVTTPGTTHYRPPALQATKDIEELERTLNGMYVYDLDGTRRLSTNSNPLEAQALQTAINEGKRELNRTGYDPASVNRSEADMVQQTAVNMLQSSPVSVEDQYGNQQLLYDKDGQVIDRPSSAYNAKTMLFPSTPVLARNAAQNQAFIDMQPALDAAKAQQVTPYQNIADAIKNIPLSQLAQQIATQRYGYDPALAQGLFDQGVDIQAMRDQADLYILQHPDLNMSQPEAISQFFGQEGLDQYNYQQAQSALYGTPTEQTAADDAANADGDAQLMSAYGVKPADIRPGDSATARLIMSDTNFYAQFQAGLAAIAQSDGAYTPAQIEQQFMQQYLTEGDPVSAILLDALLKKFTFG